jgi:hypothetical protein
MRSTWRTLPKNVELMSQHQDLGLQLLSRLEAVAQQSCGDHVLIRRRPASQLDRVFGSDNPRIRQAARSNDTRQRPLSLPEAVLHLFPAPNAASAQKVADLHKNLGSIGAMTSASQRSGLEFRFERGVSLGLKSFIARLDEFGPGVAL